MGQIQLILPKDKKRKLEINFANAPSKKIRLDTSRKSPSAIRHTANRIPTAFSRNEHETDEESSESSVHHP